MNDKLKTYDITFTEDDELKIVIDGRVYIGEKCEQVYKIINDLHYTNTSMTKRTMTFTNDKEQLIIHDLPEFERQRIIERIPNLFDDFNATYIKYWQDKIDLLHKQNRRKNFTLVTISSAVMLMLATPFLHNKLKNETNKTSSEISSEISSELPEESNNKTSFQEEVQNPISGDEIIEAQLRAYKDRTSIPTYHVNEPKSVYLEYSSKIDTPKAEYSYEQFYNDAQEIGYRWGFSPNLIMGMLTQESGGVDPNTMRIHWQHIREAKIELYDFEKEKMRTIKFTNEPEKYYGQDITCITEKDMENPYTNISAACIFLRYHMEKLNNHILAGVQCHNLGLYDMNKLLEYTSEHTGQSIDEILSDQTNISFADYTYSLEKGDEDYLAHIIQYINPSEIRVKFADSEGNITEEVLNFEGKKKGL